MADDDPYSGGVLLTASMVEDWIKQHDTAISERAETTAQRDALNIRIHELNKSIGDAAEKIRTAQAFSPRAREWLQQLEDSQPENITLTKAILSTLATAPRRPAPVIRGGMVVPGGRPGVPAPMPRDTIKAKLSQNPATAQKLQRTPDYLYVALKRLVDRTFIKEEPAGHYLITDAGRQEAAK